MSSKSSIRSARSKNNVASNGAIQSYDADTNEAAEVALTDVISTVTQKLITYLCPNCKMNVPGVPDRYPSLITHLLAAIIMLIGIVGFPPIMFLPYVLQWFARKVDRCPKCNMELNEKHKKHRSLTKSGS